MRHIKQRTRFILLTSTWLKFWLSGRNALGESCRAVVVRLFTLRSICGMGRQHWTASGCTGIIKLSLTGLKKFGKCTHQLASRLSLQKGTCSGPRCASCCMYACCTPDSTGLIVLSIRSVASTLRVTTRPCERNLPSWRPQAWTASCSRGGGSTGSPSIGTHRVSTQTCSFLQSSTPLETPECW